MGNNIDETHDRRPQERRGADAPAHAASHGARFGMYVFGFGTLEEYYECCRGWGDGGEKYWGRNSPAVHVSYPTKCLGAYRGLGASARYGRTCQHLQNDGVNPRGVSYRTETAGIFELT